MEDLMAGNESKKKNEENKENTKSQSKENTMADENKETLSQRLSKQMADLDPGMSTVDKDGKEKGFFANLWEYNKRTFVRMIYALPTAILVGAGYYGARRGLKALRARNGGKLVPFSKRNKAA